MRVICDTDLLSALAKTKQLRILTELFPKAKFYISEAVYEELTTSKEAGFDFSDDIFRFTELVALTEDEFKSYIPLREERRGLGRGELQSMVIAGSRGLVFLTNDDLAYRVAEERGVRVYKLGDILKFLWKHRIRTKKEVGVLIENIEREDNTFIKNKNMILSD
ncbi:MAG: hypothetical protein U9M95_03920 [Candidatus Altiarchaeota archaeon]|nr:hypothetical protein [Candidatus Altiarchaeota archaeon]